MPRYFVWDSLNSDHNDACVRCGDNPEDIAESYAEDIWTDIDCPDQMSICVVESEEDEPTEEQVKNATTFTVYAEQSVTFSAFWDASGDDSEDD